jgi:hypothetical protein
MFLDLVHKLLRLFKKKEKEPVNKDVDLSKITVMREKPKPAPKKKKPQYNYYHGGKRRKKNRKHRCPVTDKRQHETRESAAKAAERLKCNTQNNYLRIYVCEFCGKWHLTHKRKNRY